MKFDTKKKKTLNFLKTKAYYLNYTAIEKILNLPKGLIQKYVKYGKNIPDDYIGKIWELICLITKK